MTRQERLDDIRANPDRHRHADLGGLNACCIINGALDLGLIEAHSLYAPQGMHGGQPCDVGRGPCSCGAWHQ